MTSQPRAVRREAIWLAGGVTACGDDLDANRDEITALVAASDGGHAADEPGSVVTPWRARSEVIDLFALVAAGTDVTRVAGKSAR